MALNDNQRKILEAMQRLPSQGNSLAEIVMEVGEQAVLVGRELRMMRMGLKPSPVQSAVDQGRGEEVWFLTPDAEDYLRMKTINVQSMRRDEGRAIAIVLDGKGGTEELPLSPENAERVERAFAQNKVDLDRYANQPDEFPTPASIPVEIIDA